MSFVARRMQEIVDIEDSLTDVAGIGASLVAVGWGGTILHRQGTATAGSRPLRLLPSTPCMTPRSARCPR